MPTAPLLNVPQPLPVTPIADWGYAVADKGDASAHVAHLVRKLSDMLVNLRDLRFAIDAYKTGGKSHMVLIAMGTPNGAPGDERGHQLARVSLPSPFTFEQLQQAQSDLHRQARLVTEVHNALLAANPQLSGHKAMAVPKL